jgi:lipoate-protein ligase A
VYKKIRVIEDGKHHAAWNMAVDEALAEFSILPVLRLYGWEPPAVSIGFFQSLRDNVDLDQCKKRGVDIIRRQTGGGTVFHKDELTYSFSTSEYPEDILESYRMICGAIIEGLAGLGVKAEFSPLNDITINGKKVSGNAQTRKKGKLLQHGTLLLKTDVELMFSLLKIPGEKLKDKLIKDAKERVTELGVSFDQAKEAMKKGFKKKFDAELEPSELTPEEIEYSKEKEKKYLSPSWLWKR